MLRTLHLTLIGAFLAASIALAGETTMYRGNELPPYDIVEQDGAIELRRYQPHVLAEVTVEGDRSGGISRGFQTLAGYIFGGNAQKQKVAMTVPVVQTPREDGAGRLWTVQFMMPAKYDLADLPQPNDAAIRFVRTEPELQAVIRFSGVRTDNALREKQDALAAWVAQRGLTVASAPRYYFYDGPMTLPFRRRNEVAYRVE